MARTEGCVVLVYLPDGTVEVYENINVSDETTAPKGEPEGSVKYKTCTLPAERLALRRVAVPPVKKPLPPVTSEPTVE